MAGLMRRTRSLRDMIRSEQNKSTPPVLSTNSAGHDPEARQRFDMNTSRIDLSDDVPQSFPQPSRLDRPCIPPRLQVVPPGANTTITRPPKPQKSSSSSAINPRQERPDPSFQVIANDFVFHFPAPSSSKSLPARPTSQHSPSTNETPTEQLIGYALGSPTVETATAVSFSTAAPPPIPPKQVVLKATKDRQAAVVQSTSTNPIERRPAQSHVASLPKKSPALSTPPRTTSRSPRTGDPSICNTSTTTTISDSVDSKPLLTPQPLIRQSSTRSRPLIPPSEISSHQAEPLITRRATSSQSTRLAAAEALPEIEGMKMLIEFRRRQATKSTKPKQSKQTQQRRNSLWGRLSKTKRDNTPKFEPQADFTSDLQPRFPVPVPSVSSASRSVRPKYSVEQSEQSRFSDDHSDEMVAAIGGSVFARARLQLAQHVERGSVDEPVAIGIEGRGDHMSWPSTHQARAPIDFERPHSLVSSLVPSILDESMIPIEANPDTDRDQYEISVKNLAGAPSSSASRAASASPSASDVAPSLPPKDLAGESMASVSSVVPTAEDMPPALLAIPIPQSKFDRYSIMFGGVLGPVRELGAQPLTPAEQVAKRLTKRPSAFDLFTTVAESAEEERPQMPDRSMSVDVLPVTAATTAAIQKGSKLRVSAPISTNASVPNVRLDDSLSVMDLEARVSAHMKVLSEKPKKYKPANMRSHSDRFSNTASSRVRILERQREREVEAQTTDPLRDHERGSSRSIAAKASQDFILDSPPEEAQPHRRPTRTGSMGSSGVDEESLPSTPRESDNEHDYIVVNDGSPIVNITIAEPKQFHRPLRSYTASSADSVEAPRLASKMLNRYQGIQTASVQSAQSAPALRIVTGVRQPMSTFPPFMASDGMTRGSSDVPVSATARQPMRPTIVNIARPPSTVAMVYDA